MAETKPIQFRLDPHTVEALAGLAASNGGNLTAAAKEAAAQFAAAVAEAGALNAAELSADDWTRLAHTNGPDPFSGLELDDVPSPHGRDWSQYLAAELLGMYEGRPAVLPGHKIEAEAARELASRVAGLGRVRGYALMCALRYFWRTPDAGIVACAEPAVWLTPTAKG